MRDYTAFIIAGMVTSVAYLLSVLIQGKVILPILIAGTITLIVAYILTFLKNNQNNMENYFIYKQADYESKTIDIIVESSDKYDEKYDVLDTDFESFNDVVKHARIFKKGYEVFYHDFSIQIIIK